MKFVPNGRGFRAVIAEKSVEMNIIGGYLIHQGADLIKCSLCGRDQQAENQGRKSGHESRAKLGGILGLTGKVMIGKQSLNDESQNRGSEDEPEGRGGNLKGSGVGDKFQHDDEPAKCTPLAVVKSTY